MRTDLSPFVVETPNFLIGFALQPGGSAAHRSLPFSASMAEIGLVEVSGSVQRPGPIPPLSASQGETVTLRFRLSADGQGSLEALREARRSLLREERTRGQDAEEPSLEDAVFSATEILWVVRPSQRDWCVRKLEELRQRANRVLESAPPAGRRLFQKRPGPKS